MIATAKSISYGEAKAEYDDNKVINGVKVASEAARQNVYGDNCREVVEEMRDTQRIHSPVKSPFLDIVLTLSEEDAAKFTAANQSEWIVNLFMHDLMTDQVGLSEEDYEQMQWIAYQHEHTDHNEELKHWHILVNRTLMNGKLVSDSYIGKKAVPTVNNISREFGFTDAMERSRQNKADVYKAACFVLLNMKSYSFDRYCEGMKALGYSISLSRKSNGEFQGYNITCQTGTTYKASAVNRKLTISRLYELYKEIHHDLREKSLKHRGQSFSLPAPKVPVVNIQNMLRALDTPTVMSYRSSPPKRKRRYGKNWEDMTEDERRKAASRLSM